MRGLQLFSTGNSLAFEFSWFTKTVEEHFGMSTMVTRRRYRTHIRHGFIRVRLHMRMYHPEVLRLAPNVLEADFPLEPNGDLDLRLVGRHWGMEKCMAVDTRRMEEFSSVDPYRLGALAVDLLKSRDGYLTIIEYQNKSTEKRKAIRRFSRQWRESFVGMVPLYRAILWVSMLFALAWYIEFFSSTAPAIFRFVKWHIYQGTRG